MPLTVEAEIAQHADMRKAAADIMMILGAPDDEVRALEPPELEGKYYLPEKL